MNPTRRGIFVMECALEKCLKNHSPYWIFWGYVFFSALILGAAFFAEYAFDIEPCTFCLYERWVYGASGILALVAITHFDRKTIPYYLGGIALIYLIGFFISAYHVAIEEHLVPLPRSCGGGRIALDISLDEMRKALMEKTVVPCDMIPFTFLGISFAGYNTILSIAVFAKSVFLADYFYQRKSTKK